MALKQIVLRSRIKLMQKQLDDLRAKDAEFETRTATMKIRESELEAAISEITEETSAEERDVVEAQVAEFETENSAIETEMAEHDNAKKNLEAEIQKLQAELDEIENRQAPIEQPAEPDKERNAVYMTKRHRFFDGIATEVRSSLIARTEVKDFLTRIRALKGQKRAVTGAELEIPEILLEVLRDNLHRYSKLASKVFVKSVSGKARQTIMGSIPEGVWTEAVGALNELALSFSQIEVDGYKVGGFIPVPNSTLEDSELNLLSDIMDMIGQSIGLGVDKAIVFGSGTKMPLGFLTRLAQTSAPSDWDANAPAWTDLHTTNVLKFDPASMSSETFFANLVAYLGVAKSNYSNGQKFWVMNDKTWQTILAKTIAFNAAGALVATANGVMPIIGGDVVILEFMDDYDIAGGYGSLYLLAERAGAQIAVSDQAMFIEDQTVFKGTARYDGQPVFGEGFVIVNINNETPTTSASFASDTANTCATPYALPIAGSYATSVDVGLYCVTPGSKIYYTTDGSTPDNTDTEATATITLEATTTIKAIAYDQNGNASSVFTAAYTIT
jgi:HK97 family phage major capsid protein